MSAHADPRASIRIFPNSMKRSDWESIASDRLHHHFVSAALAVRGTLRGVTELPDFLAAEMAIHSTSTNVEGDWLCRSEQYC
jgi:hypothetical protein